MKGQCMYIQLSKTGRLDLFKQLLGPIAARFDAEHRIILLF